MKITAAPSPRGKKMSCSGKDWSERTKRLAARTPNLSIFSQGLVERLEGGWRITQEGRHRGFPTKRHCPKLSASAETEAEVPFRDAGLT